MQAEGFSDMVLSDHEYNGEFTLILDNDISFNSSVVSDTPKTDEGGLEMEVDVEIEGHDISFNSELSVTPNTTAGDLELPGDIDNDISFNSSVVSDTSQTDEGGLVMEVDVEIEEDDISFNYELSVTPNTTEGDLELPGDIEMEEDVVMGEDVEIEGDVAVECSKKLVEYSFSDEDDFDNIILDEVENLNAAPVDTEVVDTLVSNNTAVINAESEDTTVINAETEEVVGNAAEYQDHLDVSHDDNDNSISWSVSDTSDTDDEVDNDGSSHHQDVCDVVVELPAVFDDETVEEENNQHYVVMELPDAILRNLEFPSQLIDLPSELVGSFSSEVANDELSHDPTPPSSAPSSPPTAPSSPTGPRTPRLNARTRTPSSSSPFRIPPQVRDGYRQVNQGAATVQSTIDQSVEEPRVGFMRGALTYRLNQLSVRNTTRHPVSESLKESLIQNNLDRGLRFTLSNLMNDQMLLDNYLLKKNKGPIERKKGTTINWQCVSQNCYFRVTTVNDSVEHTNGRHNHDPNVEEFHKREGRVKLKQAVAAADAPLASVVLNVINETTDDAYLTAHGSNEAMKQVARRFKHSQFPDLGKPREIKDMSIDPMWFEIRPGSNETLLLFDNGAGKETEVEGSRILVFGSKIHLNLLLRSLDWMGDGTFDVCPTIGQQRFYQLYTLAGFVRDTPFTLLRVLMQKKDTKSYKELFSFMLKTALDNDWQFRMVEEGGTLLTDFEWAPHSAKNLVLSETPLVPESKVVFSAGCFFHFCSGLLKDNNVKQRMKILYDKNDEHRNDVRMLMMLAYIPVHDIPRVYDIVSLMLTEKGSKAVNLLPRLTKYYVHGYNRPSDNKLMPARFPASMWSCMDRVINNKPSTTNFLEGSHRGYDFKFMKDHPRFKDFGACLAKDIKAVEKDVRLVNESKENVVHRKRRQEIERTAAIKTSCSYYNPSFSKDQVLDYLRNLAKITSRTLRYSEVEEEED